MSGPAPLALGVPLPTLVLSPTAAQGDVSFSYTVSDGRGGTSVGVVTVTIDDDPPDLPPVARELQEHVLQALAPGPDVTIDDVIRAYEDIGMRVSYCFAVRDQNRLRRLATQQVSGAALRIGEPALR